MNLTWLELHSLVIEALDAARLPHDTPIRFFESSIWPEYGDARIKVDVESCGDGTVGIRLRRVR